MSFDTARYTTLFFSVLLFGSSPIVSGCGEGPDPDTTADMAAGQQDMAADFAQDMAAQPDLSSDLGVDQDVTPDPCTRDERVLAGECVACAPGTTSPAGADPTGPDTSCSPTLCVADARVVSNACAACPPGTTNEQGDDASGEDTQCDATLCAEDERVQDNACTACAPGTANMAGDDASSEDTQCDAQMCPSNTRVESNVCVVCPAGTNNAAGDDPAGEDTQCDAILCAQNQRVESNVCTSCPAGTLNADGGDDASGEDTQCDAVLCGENQRVESNTCVMCLAGTINDAGDDASGMDTQCDAIPCLQDERVQDNVCVMCPAGTTNQAGDDSSGMNTFCEVTFCGADEYVQSNACVPCPVGTANDPGDDASDVDTQCDVVFCAEDERVATNQCVSCAPGTVNVAGDDATGDDTDCDVVFCAQDERVDANQCVSCQPGSLNDAGDDASGMDTQCEAILCAEDERVQSNMCVACPALTSNVAGDDATGANTDCDDPCLISFGVACVDFAQAYIKASNPGSGDLFTGASSINPVNGGNFSGGGAIAIDGDTLVVGAYSEDSDATGVGGDQTNDNAGGSGAVYVFVRSGTTWTQQAYLKASNASGGHQFGQSVDISGDTIVVGAPREGSNATGVNGDQSNNLAGSSGAAYVFVRSGTTWTQQAYLKASNTQSDDRFGHTVAVDGDRVVVGAPNEDSTDPADQTNNSGTSAGAAYLFQRSGTTWSQQAYLKAPNADYYDHFGISVDISGDTVVVGSPEEDSTATGVDGSMTSDSTATRRSGAAYVFVESGGNWSLQGYLKASHPERDDYLGTVVAIDGDTIAVSAYGEDSNATGVGGDPTNNDLARSGAVYVYTRSGGTWNYGAYIKASNPSANDRFGYDLALDGDTLAIGAYEEDSDAEGLNSTGPGNTRSNGGAAYVFTRQAGVWSQQFSIKPQHNEANDQFGRAITMDAGTLVVGAHLEDSASAGIDGNRANNVALSSGAAYVYKIAP